VLSGDIANAAKLAEYQEASRFLDELAATIRKHVPSAVIQYIAVPGNHDVYLPENDEALRETLISAVANVLHVSKSDPSTLQLVLRSQDAFFDFCHAMNATTTDQDRLWGSHSFQFDQHHLRFQLFNTAILSKRHNEQGTLSVPINDIRMASQGGPDSDLVVTVFHHPYTWLQADISIQFRAVVENSSEIVLTGHQHVEHAYDKHTTIANQHIFYSEGEVLQTSNDTQQSGFRAILLDLPKRARRIVTYRWKDTLYSALHDTDWVSYEQTPSSRQQLTPTPEFLKLLSDSGMGLTNGNGDPVALQSFFVFPDVTVGLLATSGGVKQISGASFIEYASRTEKLLIQGSAYSGKTSLAKALVTLVGSWQSRG